MNRVGICSNASSFFNNRVRIRDVSVKTAAVVSACRTILINRNCTLQFTVARTVAYIGEIPVTYARSIAIRKVVSNDRVCGARLRCSREHPFLCSRIVRRRILVRSNCLRASERSRVIARSTLNGRFARLYILRSDDTAESTGRAASDNASLVLCVLEVLQRQRHLLERGHTLSLLKPERTKLRYIVGVGIFFRITSCFPLFELSDKSRGHPTIIGLVHIVAEVADIIRTRRIDRCDITVVAVAVKNRNDILGRFVNIYTLHKVVESINDIHSLSDLVRCHNVNGLIHKVKENNDLECFLDIVYHPVIAVGNALFECAALASSTRINQTGMNVCYRPVVVGRRRFGKSLTESLLNAELFAPLTENGRNGVFFCRVIAVVVRVVGIVEAIHPLLGNKALVLENGLIRLRFDGLIFNNPVIVLVNARNLEPTDVSCIYQSLGLNVIVGFKVNHRVIGKCDF